MMKNGMRILTAWTRERNIALSTMLTTLYFITLCFLTATESIAKDYTFTWSANPEPVEGYRLYYKKGGVAVAPFDGAGAAEGASPVNTGKQTTYTITGLDDNAIYHFALTAYNGTTESGYSEVITVQAATPTTTQPPIIFNIKAQVQ